MSENSSGEFDNLLEKAKKDIGAYRKSVDKNAVRQKDQLERDLKDPLRRNVDRVTDMEFSGTKPIIHGPISKYVDENNHVIYTREVSPSLEQMRELRDKIVAQQNAFSSLAKNQKAEIKTDFSSKEPSKKSKQYQDFLNSQALGERFEKLKAHPPRPTFK